MNKIIHYCWFGSAKKPTKIRKCIRSWSRFFPGYELKEWNETNFDFSSCEYAKAAFQQKKWAFLSDYARFKILYEFGGIYMDTDVMALKTFEGVSLPFLALESFDAIAPGLICGFEPGDAFCKYMVDYYEQANPQKGFVIVCGIATEWFAARGFKAIDQMQKIGIYTIYPTEYFCPLDYYTGIRKRTPNTITEHLYYGSWVSKSERFRRRFKLWFKRMLLVFHLRS